MTIALEEAIENWDRVAARPVLDEVEQQRKAFIERFPLASWESMSLEEYALGQSSTDVYSWWLEWGTPLVGSIRGGSARKHLIYLQTDGQTWHFDPSYADKDEAWTAIRAGFLEAFRLASEGRFEEIDGIAALAGANAVRVKSVHLYFPDELLPISSKAHLDHFLELLEVQERPADAVAANRLLLATLRRVPRLEKFSTNEIQKLLYRWSKPRESRLVVKIAPGRDAMYWDECLAGGYICVGWDATGDLRQFPTFDALRTKFEAAYPNTTGHVTTKAKELWTLAELQPGDVILANRGTSEILAIGTVTERGYEWLSEKDAYKHVVHVDWDTSKAKTIDPVKRWAMTTIAKVPAELFQRINSDATTGAVTTTASVNVEPVTDPQMLRLDAILQRRKQIILYGPPGTGKTYTARKFAQWRIGETELKASTGTSADYVTTVTFHPSYTYEDFIEGYKPQSTVNGTLSLELRDGLFKRVCKQAHADPDHDYLVLIDEVNRGNVPKIFGELITLLEADKRGVEVTLPQSGDAFLVPPNVYVIGTMNTADRSIHLLDVALRRRFSFIELLPDPDLLNTGLVGTLELDVFLRELNSRLLRTAGRERQLGHAMLMTADGAPIETAEEFSQAFRYEVLPLLQEYCYEDYSVLAELLGDEVIDVDSETPRWEVVDDPDQLTRALATEFSASSISATDL